MATFCLRRGSGALRLPGLLGNYASSPDSVATSITGDIDLRAKVAMDRWTPTSLSYLLNKWNTVGNQRSYAVGVSSSGQLQYNWSNDGTTNNAASSTVATGVPDGSIKWVRITHAVNNGAAGNDVKFYLSDDGVTWSPLGSTVTGGSTTAIFDGTAPAIVGGINTGGSNPPTANVLYAEIRNGIGGTVVASFNAALVTTTSSTAPITWANPLTSETWTLNGTSWSWLNGGAVPSALRSSVAGGAPGDTLHYQAVGSVTATDTTTCADTLARRNVLTRPLSDSTTEADTQVRTAAPKRLPADTLAEADGVVRVVGRSRTSADSETLTDTVARRNVLAEGAAESTTWTDTQVRAAAPKRTTVDSEALADSVARDYDPKRTPADSLSLIEAVARALVTPRTGAETTVWSDTSLGDYEPKRALAEQWSTGVGPIAERLVPDYIRAQVHYVGTVAMIQDDPDSADANWISDDGTLGELRVSFPQPAANLTTGAGLQEFRIRVRPG